MPFVQRVVSPIYISRSSRSLKSSYHHHHHQQQAQSNVAAPRNANIDDCDGLRSVSPHQTVNGAVSAVPVSLAAGYSSGELVAGTGSTSNSVVHSGNNLIVNNHNSVVVVNSGSGCSAGGSVLTAPISDNELESVTNLTLSNALRQLGSLVLLADEIFAELNKELKVVAARSNGIKTRIGILQIRVEEFDPKLVAVPESDLESFVLIKNHFKSRNDIATALFTIDTRTDTLQKLYDAAAKTPVTVMCEMDRILGVQNGERRASDLFLCTPILGQSRKRMKSNVDVEIETRLPASVDELRKWTSTEAIGDITVTPDCVAHINSTQTGAQLNITSSIVNNTQSGVSMPGPSTSSIDAPDAITSIASTSSRCNDTTATATIITDDMPLDHRLPSPEEQSQIIALKFPATVIQVDTSGRRFDRMSSARKSMLHVQTNMAATASSSGSPEHVGEPNDIETDTVKRRSRSRKPRGKRRNTIAGTDQKEIEEAVIGDVEPTTNMPTSDIDDITMVPRSKSSDILKTKDSLYMSLPTGDSSSTNNKTIARSHFNTLKQWGKNRLKFMNRSNEEKSKERNGAGNNVPDIDNFNVSETYAASQHQQNGNSSSSRKKMLEKERKLSSHERKPSYSSSEKSLTITGAALPASINPVKLRESSSIRRQRRNGLGYKDEPHSSSGNWSASSESGRTSIGSEITAQPKSSASSNSLNHTLHLSSGPPSSIISRRRFLNTSASSSVTSEGTVTPDLQTQDLYDDETSSAYSCDTEGYYTSFHIDSGLKTLKEEEPPTPLHTSSALSSNNSFGSTSVQTVLSAENEYELFGRGSTSTTTSSAGTVCTTLMASFSDRNLVIGNSSGGSGPAVPERKSSLTKLNRSSSTASSGSLERSYSSSTVGSTLERTGTIKRNGVLLQKEVAAVLHQHKQEERRTESPDSGNNTSSSPVESNTNSSPTQGVRSCSEFEYSESSDLEGVDRIERIRVKTTINTSRIPSMCVITPLNSDDESSQHQPNSQPTSLDYNHHGGASYKNESRATQIQNEIKKEVHHFRRATLLPLNNMLGRLKTVLPTLNKKSPNKEINAEIIDSQHEPVYDAAGEYVTIKDVRNANTNSKQNHLSGVYYSNDVVKRNLTTVLSGNLNEETEYVSLNELPCNMRCDTHSIITMDEEENNHQQQQQKHQHQQRQGAKGINNEKKGENIENVNMNRDEEEGYNRRGARVTLDAQGKVVYSSDSLKRRKGAHTTFAPGPCVKEINNLEFIQENNNLALNQKVNCALPGDLSVPASPLKSGGVSNRKLLPIRPVTSQQQYNNIAAQSTSSITTTGTATTTPTTSQFDKIVIRASSASSLQQQGSGEGNSKPEIMRMTPVATITAHPNGSITPNTFNNHTPLNNLKGAYVNVQDVPSGINPPASGNGRILTSLPESEFQDYQHSSHDESDSPIKYGSYFPSTLPRASSNCDEIQGGTSSPFQRSNNMYWTLQARKSASAAASNHSSQRSSNNMYDRSNQHLISPSRDRVPIEDLYSTPHKNRKIDLKTTPLGFSTFFSPISKQELREESHNNMGNVSPIDPRNSIGTFKTSTPSKMNNESYDPRINSPSRMLSEELRNKLRIHENGQGGSAGNSPASSGRSTPRLEPQMGRGRNSWALDKEQSQTCSDRMGQNKTTLLDFKKLLLAQAGKVTTSTVSKKPSAVELLKLGPQKSVSPTTVQTNSGVPAAAATQPTSNANNINSSMTILDMSGSPKTFSNRRHINRQIVAQNPNSPTKTLTPPIKHYASPKSSWRLNNIRSNVMSTAIPEVNSEEDSSPNNSTGPSPSATLSPIKESTVIEEKINMRDNIFLKSEENNFMKHEIPIKIGGYNANGVSRSQYLQAQRAQFLMGNNNNNNNSNINNNLKTQQYNNKYGISTSPTAAIITNSGSHNNGGIDFVEKPRTASPSLETAL